MEGLESCLIRALLHPIIRPPLLRPVHPQDLQLRRQGLVEDQEDQVPVRQQVQPLGRPSGKFCGRFCYKSSNT